MARVAELVDAADLKSAGHCGRAGSIPASGTSFVRAHIALTLPPNPPWDLSMTRLGGIARRQSGVEYV